MFPEPVYTNTVNLLSSRQQLTVLAVLFHISL